MPVWLQILSAVVVILGAIAGLWKTFVKPAAKLITSLDEMLPLAREIVRLFGGSPNLLSVVKSMAAQFATDGGSSLRDVVNDLADGIARLERVADDVGNNLVAAQHRADSTSSHDAGAAADVAAMSPPSTQRPDRNRP